MNKEDHLKDIFREIDNVNDPIDLEERVLGAIATQESLQGKIGHYKAKAMMALKLSVGLIAVLGILFSFSTNVRTMEYSIVTYTAVILTLIILFIQLEISRTRTVKNHKITT
ncbi:hypothetical protein [Marivirga sericea]|nr:hypothetical protein [Marivirga sericea]